MTETEYDKIWKRMRDELNVKASDYVPQMYNALIQDGYTPKEARDKIKKDCFNIWKVETIDKWIPAEAKKEILVLAGKKGAEIKQKKRLDYQSSHDDKPIVLDSPSSKNQDSDISLTDEEIQRIAETEDVNSPRNVEITDTTQQPPVESTTTNTIPLQTYEVVCEQRDRLVAQLNEVAKEKRNLENQLGQQGDSIIFDLSVTETALLYTTLLKKQTTWKYGQTVTFEWNKTKNTLRPLFKQ